MCLVYLISLCHPFPLACVFLFFYFKYMVFFFIKNREISISKISFFLSMKYTPGIILPLVQFNIFKIKTFLFFSPSLISTVICHQQFSVHQNTDRSLVIVGSVWDFQMDVVHGFCCCKLPYFLWLSMYINGIWLELAIYRSDILAIYYIATYLCTERYHVRIHL